MALPTIPENITVHLGPPSANAENVTVPFIHYIANVASSELYPTWPEAALRANITAQVTFALNRVYTEYYRSRGYDFDITNSTAYDQAYVNGRSIFENVRRIVGEIFTTYIRRENSVEPLFAQFCDGIQVTCNGLSQWGSVSLANDGLSPADILRYYYGNNIVFMENTPVAGSSVSAPPFPLSLGSFGNNVRAVQLRLNRISNNFPSIPKIALTDGIFSTDTEAAVRRFQEVFGLTPDGVPRLQRFPSGDPAGGDRGSKGALPRANDGARTVCGRRSLHVEQRLRREKLQDRKSHPLQGV